MQNVKQKKFFKCVAMMLFVVLILITIALATITLINNINYAKLLKIVDSFSSVTDIDTLRPTMLNGEYVFITDDELKIMQLTDVHIGGGINSFERDKKAINAVATMISVEKPDLVIVTGDIAFAVPDAANFDNLISHRVFVRLMENLGVNWTVSFGNHDSEWYNFYNREFISELYADKNNAASVFLRGDSDIYGEGNQKIKILSSQNLVREVVYIFDSNSYIGQKYDNIHADQIAWYKKDVLKTKNDNIERLRNIPEAILVGDRDTYIDVQSLAFFHIPLEEYRTASDIYNKSGETDDVKYIHGFNGEKIWPGEFGDNLFETMLELGSTKGVFVGHDHKNNMALEYKGIVLAYSMSIDYLAYPDLNMYGSYRGCTLITINKDGSFFSENSSYYQEKYVSHIPKEAFLHDPALKI